MSEPKFLDPTPGAWISIFMAAQIFDTLLTFDEKLAILPNLAESWEVRADEKAFVFKIREGVKWHDGKPLTVEDIKFSFEKIISKYDVFGSFYFKDVIVEIVDKRTVKIKPEFFVPAAQLELFSLWSTSIYPKHILEDVDFPKSEFRFKPIGTGPFKFVEWIKGSHITLERNPHYWKPGAPMADTLIVRFIPDPATMVAAVELGELHYAHRLPFEAYHRLKANPDLEPIPADKPDGIFTIEINLKHPILSDLRVRKALAHAINKAELISKVTLGVWTKVADSFWSPANVAGKFGKIPIYMYDPTLSEKLLDEAGYKRGPDGKRFRLEILTWLHDPLYRLSADVLREQLVGVGIDAVVKAVDFATLMGLRLERKYEITLLNRWIAPFYFYQVFHSKWDVPGAWTNIMGYNNPKVDEYYEKWLVEVDPEARMEYLRKINEIVLMDLPWIPLYYYVYLDVRRKDVGGPDLPAGRYMGYAPLIYTYIIPPAPPVPPPPVPVPIDPIMVSGYIVALAIAVVAVAIIMRMRRRRA